MQLRVWKETVTGDIPVHKGGSRDPEHLWAGDGTYAAGGQHGGTVCKTSSRLVQEEHAHIDGRKVKIMNHNGIRSTENAGS